MTMHELQIGPDWVDQIAGIRDAVTADTNLVRADGTPYRICRDDVGEFGVMLRPFWTRDQPGLQLAMQATSLWVTEIGGRRFENYAQHRISEDMQAITLDNAVLDATRVHGVELFLKQSLIVLCVAESLRSDHIASKVGHAIRATTSGLRGVRTPLAANDLMPFANKWGKTSDAIHGAMLAENKTLIVNPGSTPSAKERQTTERVALELIKPDLRRFANMIKVLKRPNL